MDALYYQSIIIGTIIVTAIFFIKHLKKVALGWSVFSILFLTIGSALFIFQLVVIWISYYLTKKYFKQKVKLNELEDILSNYDTELKEQITNNYKNYAMKSIKGKEHYSYMNKSLINSKESVIILSGWISDYVIDEGFINILRQLLKNEIHIFIGYGYLGNNNQHLNNTHTENALNNLRKLYSEATKNNYKGNLYVANFPNHQKIMIIDTEKTIIGSANWLSNRMYKNEEYSIEITSDELTTFEKNRLLKYFKDYHSSYSKKLKDI